MTLKSMLQQSHSVHCAGSEIMVVAQLLLQLLPTVGCAQIFC